jgi:hypothetical protein
MPTTVSTKLVELIERDADHLTQRWLEIVRGHEDLPTYGAYDEHKLYERGFTVYSQLGRWLSSETTKEGIKAAYTALGAQRRLEGFRLSEVIEALIITRRVLWAKIESDGLLDTALDLNQALELNDRALVFFDRAMFYAAQGYESAAATREG